MLNYLYLIILILLISSKEADAYLDPGTGSYIFQVVIAGILSALFFLRQVWSRFRSFFKKNEKR